MGRNVTVSLAGAGGGGGTNIAAGLIHDQVDYAVEAKSKPSLLGTYVDSYFGVTVRRITAAGSGFGIVPVYSTIPLWNYDESYLLLYDGNYRLHNGTTYAFIRNVDISPPDIEQTFWSPVDPDDLFWVDGNVLKCYHPSSDASTTVKTFTGYTSLTSGGDPQYLLSWDGNRLSLASSSQAFTYDIQNDTILSTMSHTASEKPQMCPSGDNVYLGVYGNIPGKVMDVDSIGTVLRTLDMKNGGEHCSMGRLANGHDFLATNAYDPPGSEEPIDYVGALIIHDLTDATFRIVVGEKTGWQYPTAGHMSALSYKAPGWVVLSTYDYSVGAHLGEQEIQLVDCNDPTGIVYRVCHHRSTEATTEYWGEPHASASPSGTRIVFGSNWGGSIVDTYVAELPSYS